MIEDTRKENGRVVLVDVGDFAGRQATTSTPRGLFLLEMAKTLHYDAVTLGEGDAAFGAEMFRAIAADSTLPAVSANLRDAASHRALLPAMRVVERDGVRVGITAVTAPANPDGGELARLGVETTDPEEALQEVLPGLRAACDVVVLLARMSLGPAKGLGDRFPDLLDVVVVGGGETGRGMTGIENGGAVYVVAGDRGQALGRARIALGPDRRPTLAVADEIGLDRDVRESPEIAALVKEFQTNLNEILKEEAVRTAQGRAAPDGSYYLGASACGECHVPEYRLWLETPHAHAFQTLVDAGTESLPECFRCHVTGSGQPGGYEPGRPESESLRNVQCEVCHGRGSHHARDGSWGRALGRNVCRSCHDADNSPDFDPEIYWTIIRH